MTGKHKSPLSSADLEEGIDYAKLQAAPGKYIDSAYRLFWGKLR